MVDSKNDRMIKNSHMALCISISLALSACGYSDRFDDENTSSSNPSSPNMWSTVDEPMDESEAQDDEEEPQDQQEDNTQEDVMNPVDPVKDIEDIEDIKKFENLSRCELKQLWWDPVPRNQLRSDILWSPDMSVVSNFSRYSQSAELLRHASTGEVILTHAGTPAESFEVSPDWSLFVTQEHINGAYIFRVYDRVSQQLVLAVPASNHIWKISDDGSTFVTYGVVYADTDHGEFHVDAWDIATGNHLLDASITTERGAPYWSLWAPTFDVSADGSTIALALVDRPDWEAEPRPVQPLVVTYQRTEGGSFIEQRLNIPEVNIVEPGGYTGHIAEVRLDRHQDDTLHVIDAAGAHHTINHATNAITHTSQRGAFTSNWETYLPPIYASPLEWSDDGDLFASVNPAGEVEILSTSSPHDIKIISPPEIDAEVSRYFPEGRSNVPVSMAFSPDNTKIIVSFSQGTGVWGCGQTTPEYNAPTLSDLNVVLPVMLAANKHHLINLEFIESSESYFALANIYVDGNLQYIRYVTDRVLDLNPLTPGMHTIEVEVFNAHDSIRSEPMIIHAIN